MCTVHAPHWPMPQPNFVPLRSRWSRSTQSSGVSSATSTVLDLPLTLNVTVMASSWFSFVALECPRPDFGAVDDSLRVNSDSLRGAGLPGSGPLVRIGDERHHRAVLGAADAHPPLPRAVRGVHGA